MSISPTKSTKFNTYQTVRVRSNELKIMPATNKIPELGFPSLTSTADNISGPLTFSINNISAPAPE